MSMQARVIAGSTLLLDIGNSRLKWAALASPDAPLTPVQAMAHEGAPAQALVRLAQHWHGAAPAAVCIAHVTGAGNEALLVEAVNASFGLAPRFARSVAECAGLKSAYTDPARLGVDRWLAMLALWTRERAAFCVANAGTALTFDVVDATGAHQGGVIAPGLATLVEATLGRTRFEVGDMAGTFGDKLGRDTETCVRQGALHAAAGLLDRLGSRHAGVHVLAGGDAAILQPHLANPWQIEPDLVLHGLAMWVRLASAR